MQRVLKKDCYVLLAKMSNLDGVKYTLQMRCANSLTARAQQKPAQAMAASEYDLYTKRLIITRCQRLFHGI